MKNKQRVANLKKLPEVSPDSDYDLAMDLVKNMQYCGDGDPQDERELTVLNSTKFKIYLRSIIFLTRNSKRIMVKIVTSTLVKIKIYCP